MADFQIFENEQIIEPGGYGKAKFQPSGTLPVDTSTMLIIGESEGGVPYDDTDLPEKDRVNIFTNPQDAREILRAGDLLEAVLIAFDPVNDPDLVGARRVIAVRVNPATKSSLLLDGIVAASKINIESKDYGKHTKQTAIQIDSQAHPDYSDIHGAYITLYKDGETQESDFICNPLLGITYTGASLTRVMRYVSATKTLTIEDPAATPVHTMDIDEFETIGQLADYIATLADMEVELLGDPATPAALMDDTYVGAAAAPVALAPNIAARLAATYEAQLQWLENVSRYTVSDDNSSTIRVPLDDLTKTFLAGGTHSSPVTQDWIDSIAIAEAREEVFYQIELSGDIGIASLNASSVKFSNRVKERRERIGGSGEGDYENQTDAQRQAKAKLLNSFLYCFATSPLPRIDSNGKERIFQPKFAVVASMAINSGNGPSVASTFKPLVSTGVAEEYKQDVRDAYIKSGCQIITPNPNTGIPRILRSVTTYQGAQLIPSEMSMVATALAMVKTFRKQMEDAFVGRNVTSDERGLMEAKAREILDGYVDLGWLTSSDTQAAYTITQFEFTGDTLRIISDLTEVSPLNFIFSLMNISAIGL